MSFFNRFKKNKFPDAGEKNSPEVIICGLGNPGTSYENTRHNCGFMALDLLAEQEGFKIKKLKFKSMTALEVIDGVKCFVMKPTTYMNRSGDALSEAMKFYKIPPEKTIVIFDDFSLPFGNLKIRMNGSDGGHNGMKSLILSCNSDMFPRVKIGIGAPPHPDYPVKDWVLSPFKKDEGKTLEDALDRAVKATRLLIKGESDRAMNEFNVKL